MRGTAPAKFIRPVDLELLSAPAPARLWDAHYSYGLPDLLRPRGAQAIAVIRRLCDTGLFLHDNFADAHLSWSKRSQRALCPWRLVRSRLMSLSFSGRVSE